jgi:hypothetical protein
MLFFAMVPSSFVSAVRGSTAPAVIIKNHIRVVQIPKSDFDELHGNMLRSILVIFNKNSGKSRRNAIKTSRMRQNASGLLVMGR